MSLTKDYEIGKGAATEIKIEPKELLFIEARGFLCHELLYLIGGNVEFVETSWKQFVLKVLEYLFPILPVCRWYPPENNIIECVGYHSMNETKVFRITPNEGHKTVFFVKYKPEPPILGNYIHSLFKTPMLDIGKFLRPPFDESNNNQEMEALLHHGIVPPYLKSIALTEGAKKYLIQAHLETCKGLWEGFSE